MSLTQKQIKEGFWGMIGDNDLLPKKSTTTIEEYKPGPCLDLVITQVPKMTAYQQKKLVEAWCEKLPQLTEVKYLWFHSRVNQKMFDAACQVPNLEGLYIKWSGIKDISALKHAKKLRHLHIGSSSQIESIEPLGDLKKLITLDLVQLNNITDFSVLETLTQLEGLGVEGSMWTAQKIGALESIGKLTNLKYLSLSNTRMKVKSFDPLLKLKKLVCFYCSWNYPEEEFEKLKALPNLKYGNIETSWKKVKSLIEKA